MVANGLRLACLLLVIPIAAARTLPAADDECADDVALLQLGSGTRDPLDMSLLGRASAPTSLTKIIEQSGDLQRFEQPAPTVLGSTGGVSRAVMDELVEKRKQELLDLFRDVDSELVAADPFAAAPLSTPPILRRGGGQDPALHGLGLDSNGVPATVATLGAPRGLPLVQASDAPAAEAATEAEAAEKAAEPPVEEANHAGGLRKGLLLAMGFGISLGMMLLLGTDQQVQMWDKFKDQKNPDVFKHLSLAHDGGFTEVNSLYHGYRWFSAAILVAFVVYNIYYVVALDLDFLYDPRGTVKAMGGTGEIVLEPYYFCRKPSNAFVKWFYADSKAEVSPVQVIGALEMLGVVLLIIYGFSCLVQVVLRPGFRRWFAVQAFFWDLLPTMSTYSAMKLLNFLVPTVFCTHAFEFITEYQERKAERKSTLPVWLSGIAWLAFMAVAFLVGFDTFLMKMRVVSILASDPELSRYQIMSCLQFLAQVLGVVQMGPFVRKRLFVFIFGGEDGIMQDEETCLMQTWNALLARAMYVELSLMRFLAVMLSFSDEDFQRLVLNENQVEKEREIGM